MDQPRPRHKARKPLIIERPDLQTPPQRVMSGMLTAAFWVVWIYLWLPLIGVLGWAFGVSRFYEEMITFDGYEALLELLDVYLKVVALLAGSLIAWAVYNWIRFRGEDRRKARAEVTTAEIAEYAGLDAAQLERWQSAQILRVEHHDDGRIAGVSVLSPQPRRSSGRPTEPAIQH